MTVNNPLCCRELPSNYWQVSSTHPRVRNLNNYVILIDNLQWFRDEGEIPIVKFNSCIPFSFKSKWNKIKGMKWEIVSKLSGKWENCQGFSKIQVSKNRCFEKASVCNMDDTNIITNKSVFCLSPRSFLVYVLISFEFSKNHILGGSRL